MSCPGVLFFAGGLIRLGVGHGQHGLIVEHFLKMRYQPSIVRRVPVEPETDMVVNSALTHSLKCMFHHVESALISAAFPGPKQKEHVMRCGELGSITEAAVLWIITLRKLAKGRIQNIFAQRLTRRFFLN